jgi:hypothetical protein
VADKRDNYRHLKRLPVKFGVGAASTSGFTEDISHFGFFIKAGLVQGPGRELVVELSLPPDCLVRMVAKVQWAKRIPPALLRSYKGGMGFTIVRFLEGEEYYRALCDELQQVRMERNRWTTKNLSSEGGGRSGD